jgi:hypothetical protein
MKELMINADMAEPTLFDEIDFQAGFEKFERELQLRFGGGAPTPEQEILAYALQDTEYLPMQMKRALLEIGGIVEEGHSGSRRVRHWRIP